MSIVSADNQMSEVLPEDHWVCFSFVPKDLPWCDWLYFTLHGYPVPAALAVRATRFGFPLPDSISAFPDPNDATHQHRLDSALGRARWLVVVVSPHSAHSQQIDEHIRAFKKAGGEERIIALVVEGAPPSTSTLCVKSENKEWLPLWLQWRLGRDGRFQASSPSEPLIIDARPGYSSLDDVMTTLISVLLDVPREELELLEALTPDDGEFAKASVVSAREKLVAAAMADFDDDQPARTTPRPVEPAPRKRELVRRPGFLLAVGGSLILATIACVVAFRNVDVASVPTVAELAAPRVIEAKSPPNAVEVITASKPERITEDLSVAPQPEPASQPSVVAMVETPSVAEAATSPSATVVEPPDAPAENERQNELRIAIKAVTNRAEVLLDRGQYEDAAAAFEEAIESTQQLLLLPDSGTGTRLQLARLYQTLGALQMRIASDAEARRTLEMGLKALGKANGNSETAGERSRLKIEMSALLNQVKRGGEESVGLITE